MDEEVIDKLRLTDSTSKDSLSKFEKVLWDITKCTLNKYAKFNSERYSFELIKNPFPECSEIPLGKYKIGKNVTDAHIFRPGHPLTQSLLKRVKRTITDNCLIEFELSNHKPRITILEELKVKQGLLYLVNIVIESFETTDNLVFTGVCDDGCELSNEHCQRLFSLKGILKENVTLSDTEQKQIDKLYEKRKEELIASIKLKDNNYFLKEVDKLTKWADDMQLAAENEIKETKGRIKELNRQSKSVVNPIDQLQIQKELQELTHKQRKQRQQIFEIEDSIEENRKKMVEDIEVRMKQKVSEEKLFIFKWKLM
jgi:hypothetical protein